MKEFISDLGVIPSASCPMKIFCDNTGEIALAKESRFHKRTKHIKRRFNSIRHQVAEGDIDICKIHTDLNVADPLNKSFPRAKRDQHQSSTASFFQVASRASQAAWYLASSSGISFLNATCLALSSGSSDFHRQRLYWPQNHSKVGGSVKEICPRGNNKVVIYIYLYHDKCLLFMLELY